MQKFLLIPAALFVLCMALVVSVALDPSVVPEAPAAAEPAAAPETAPVPAETVPETEAAPQEILPAGPQRTAFPLRPTDPEYFKTMLTAVTIEKSPNNELQRYIPEQVEISGRHIRITADKLEDQYVSGRAESLLAFRYGTMTFKVNCLDNPGFFPAVWMLPADGTLFPEIDIYEHIGREPQYFYGVNHYEVSDGHSSYHTNENFMHTSPLYDLPEDYTLTFEWRPDHMRWSLNGQPLYTMVDHIPDEPMYLIINMAVGGIWCEIPNVLSTWPAVMDVEFLDFRPQELYTR